MSNWKVEKALVKKKFFVELKVNEVVMEANKAVMYLWLGSLLEWIGADPATPAETIIIKKRYQPALQLKSLSLWYLYSSLNQNIIAFSRKIKQPFFFFFPKDNKYFSIFKKENKNNSSFPLWFPSYCAVCKKKEHIFIFSFKQLGVPLSD